MAEKSCYWFDTYNADFQRCDRTWKTFVMIFITVAGVAMLTLGIYWLMTSLITSIITMGIWFVIIGLCLILPIIISIMFRSRK